MALGIVDDSVFDAEMEKISAIIIDKPKPGRQEGTKEVPETIREIIGDTAIESGRKDALELASFFDVSPASASAYAKGATSTASYKSPSENLGKHIARTKKRISFRASSVLKRALKEITDDKLESASATELIAVARGASSIVKDMEPPPAQTPQNGPIIQQFVLHAPPIAKEDKYQVIDMQAIEEADGRT